MYTASVDNADPDKMTEDELKDESVVEKRAVLGTDRGKMTRNGITCDIKV